MGQRLCLVPLLQNSGNLTTFDSDVLLRHYQSCTEVKDRTSLSSRETRKRAVRACQGCAELKIRCTGEESCAKCVRAGKRCIYGKRSNANRRRPERTGISPRADLGGSHRSLAEAVNSSRDEEELESVSFTSLQTGDRSGIAISFSNSCGGIARSSSDRIDGAGEIYQNKDCIPSGQSPVHQIVSDQEFFRICSNNQTRLPKVNSKSHGDGTQQPKAASNKRGTYVSNAW